MRKFLLIFMVLVAVVWTCPAEGDAVSRDSVVVIKECLSLLGFDPGPFDGVLGERTAQAYTAWMRKNNLGAQELGRQDAAVTRLLLEQCRNKIASRGGDDSSKQPHNPARRLLGFSEQQVRDALGDPRAVFGVGENLFWFYTHPERPGMVLGVHFASGRVSVVEVLTQEELERALAPETPKFERR